MESYEATSSRTSDRAGASWTHHPQHRPFQVHRVHRQSLSSTDDRSDRRAKTRRICYSGRVARRLNSPGREQLNAEQLQALRRKLAAMSEHDLATFYRSTHNACRYEVRLPSPRMIQELVQAWKQLRKVAM